MPKRADQTSDKPEINQIRLSYGTESFVGYQLPPSASPGCNVRTIPRSCICNPMPCQTLRCRMRPLVSQENLQISFSWLINASSSPWSPTYIAMKDCCCFSKSLWQQKNIATESGCQKWFWSQGNCHCRQGMCISFYLTAQGVPLSFSFS